MIIPELPDYLTSLGGEDYKGLIIALFTMTAAFSRPFSGRLSDTIGRLPVMFFGAGICVVMGLLYPIMATVPLFFMLRFFHGFSTGFLPTAVTAYIADIVPVHRRGEAMGIVGVFGTTGMAAGPALGGLIGQYYGVVPVFYISSGCAFLSLLMLTRVTETLAEKQPFSLGLLKIGMDDILEKRVLVPAFVLITGAFSFGVMLTIIPDLSKHLGIQNKGLFFTVFTLASIIVRFIAGRASDRLGRVPIIIISALLLVNAMVFIGLAQSFWMLMFGAVLFGLATGMNSPTVLAWTIDLSSEGHRGRAMATVFIALEIGIGAGALTSGFLFANNPANFPLVFFSGAVLASIGLIFLVTGLYRRWIPQS